MRRDSFQIDKNEHTDKRATIIKNLLKILAGIGILAIAIGLGVWNSRAGQDWLLEQALAAATKRPPPMSEYDGLKVFLGGTSSPLPDPDRAQACVAILAGEDLYLVDAGAGSAQVATLGRLKAAAGSRMEKILADIQDYHAHTSDLAALAEQSAVRRLALYHLVPPPQNALFAKIFARDLPEGTIITEDGMIFELPAGSGDVSVVAP